MNETQMFATLKNMLSKEILDSMMENLVYQEPNGDYVLFNKYVISSTASGWVVLRSSDELTHTFTTLKNAVTWATMDKRNLVMAANDMTTLDRQLEGMNFNIEVHKNLCKTTKDIGMKIIYLNKLQQDILKKQSLSARLESYANNIRNWQFKQFKQQTAK